MIKRHRNTGLMYFCKTSTRHPLKYYWSGSYWKKHLKIHGKDVDTVWYRLFDCEEDLVEFALFFSEVFDIVAATTNGKKIWANELPEDGLQGGQNRGMPSPLKGIPTGRPSVWKGKSRPEHSMMLKGRKQTIEHSNKISQALKQYTRTPEHNAKISEAKKGKPNHKISIALKNRQPIECPHCGLIGKSVGNMKRYHFDNCKRK
jgi:hypothetical protein